METHNEAREAFDTLGEEIGPKCYVSAELNLNRRYGAFNGETLCCAFYPNGLTGTSTSFTVHANSWADLLQAARDKWAEVGDLHTSAVIKAMAIAIVRLTYEAGECTDRALRCEFEAADVAKYGVAASSMANEMAEKGPFSIVSTDGANDTAEAA